MSDIEYIDGLIVKAPNERAPDYVKCKLSIKREDLLAWLAKQDGEWINADVKVSKGGKWYAAVDNWKPDGKRQDAPKGGGSSRQPPRDVPSDGDFVEDDIPFIRQCGPF